MPPYKIQGLNPYLILDGTTTSNGSTLGFAGAGYLTPAQDGFCQVDFLVELGP